MLKGLILRNIPVARVKIISDSIDHTEERILGSSRNTFVKNKMLEIENKYARSFRRDSKLVDSKENLIRASYLWQSELSTDKDIEVQFTFDYRDISIEDGAIKDLGEEGFNLNIVDPKETRTAKITLNDLSELGRKKIKEEEWWKEKDYEA